MIVHLLCSVCLTNVMRNVFKKVFFRVLRSVAEPSLFRAAPAPEVRGPGARGEPTPAQTKLGRLRLWGKKRPLQAAAAPGGSGSIH